MTEQQSSRDRGVGVTLKGATGYDAPWITFSGSVDEVKADIIAAFGFDETSNAADLDLHDLTVEAAKAFSAQYSVAASLGGKPVGRGRGKAKATTETPAATSGGSEGDGWDDTPASAPEPEADAGPDLSELIAGCDSVADLRNLWADHTAAFEADPDLLAKWKARGRALSAA